jgi:hypothetical protein
MSSGLEHDRLMGRLAMSGQTVSHFDGIKDCAIDFCISGKDLHKCTIHSLNHSRLSA